MVSRGIERYGEEKYQEAIDQFTKAIALDPNYAEAWERRAEAYAQLGRPQQAEDDRRHLKWLDPSSSPG
jgi:Flp pilus assembly protein TadD